MSREEGCWIAQAFSRRLLGGSREAETCWSAACGGPARRCNDGLTPVVFKL